MASGDDDLRPGGHCICNFGLVQIERVGPNIDEDRPRAPQDEGVDGGNKREIRDDDLVAWLHTEQQRTHIQRMCAGRREQDPWYQQPLLQQCVALLCERSVTGDMAALKRLKHVLALFPHGKWTIEINRHATHPFRRQYERFSQPCRPCSGSR
jgi:hypothetical protein